MSREWKWIRRLVKSLRLEEDAENLERRLEEIAEKLHLGTEPIKVSGDTWSCLLSLACCALFKKRWYRISLWPCIESGREQCIRIMEVASGDLKSIRSRVLIVVVDDNDKVRVACAEWIE